MPTPPYYKPLKPRMTRRAFFCDYRAPGFFMITITAAAGTPPLGRLSTDGGTPQIILSPLGELIRQSIENFTANTPEIHIPTYIIMPDHFHMLLHVRRHLHRHLGRIIGAFKGGISGRHAQLTGATEVTPLFKPKFHDRIVTRRGQLDTLARYIADNPRRLAIRRMHPDLFRRYNHLCIGTREYAAYGNIFLLKDFDRRPVMVHRAWTAGELQENERQWLSCAANGGVLVSPFISRAEKEVRDKAIASGGRIIELRAEGFPERFKPSGKEFELCTAGQLLLLAPWPDNSCRFTMTRSTALTLNAMAAEICASALATTLRVDA